VLEEYKDKEQIIYKQMKNSITKGLSHAYLFNLNGNVYSENMIMAFVKNILCTEHKTIEDYKNCPLCKRIDEDNYPELKKIIPDGLYIKKEQLDELQKSFSTKSIESSKRIYIIYDAEKLNKSAANSLLKFLEEPEEGIIAILLTNNINLMLDTIISRCQVLNFKKNRVEEYIKYKEINTDVTLHKIAFTIWKIEDLEIDSKYKEFVDNAINFIKFYESNGLNSLLNIKKNFTDIFKEKNEVLDFFQCLILFYRDVINYKINGQVMYYDDYLTLIKEVDSNNTDTKLIYKINVIIEKEKLVKNNANLSLLIDSVIIDMEEW